MTELEITRCQGEGMGTCTGCGTWTWMSLLFDVEGFPGHWCADCVRGKKYDNPELLEVEE
jgi:hypothetical protein